LPSSDLAAILAAINSSDPKKLKGPAKNGPSKERNGKDRTFKWNAGMSKCKFCNGDHLHRDCTSDKAKAAAEAAKSSPGASSSGQAQAAKVAALVDLDELDDEAIGDLLTASLSVECEANPSPILALMPSTEPRNLHSPPPVTLAGAMKRLARETQDALAEGATARDQSRMSETDPGRGSVKDERVNDNNTSSNSLSSQSSRENGAPSPPLSPTLQGHQAAFALPTKDA